MSFSSESSLPATSAEISTSLETLKNSIASNIAPSMASEESRTGVTGSITSSATPQLNLSSLQHSYSDILSNGWDSRHFSEMFGMLLPVVTKQQDMDALSNTVQSNTEWITELENKVGSSEEISERLGLLIRNLSIHPVGKSELDQFRDALSHIIPYDIRSDKIKAKRVGNTQSYVGVLKVEVKNEEVRSAIMTK